MKQAVCNTGTHCQSNLLLWPPVTVWRTTCVDWLLFICQVSPERVIKWRETHANKLWFQTDIFVWQAYTISCWVKTQGTEAVTVKARFIHLGTVGNLTSKRWSQNHKERHLTVVPSTNHDGWSCVHVWQCSFVLFAGKWMPKLGG